MRNITPLNLHALDMFRHVAVEGSILGASAKLNRVQSNVSTRIKQLEEQVGAALFVRKPRGLSLTDDGKVLLGYAEQMLALSNEALDALHSTHPAGEFRIGTMESTAAVRLPSVLSAYHRQFADVQIHVETDTAGALTNRLLAGDIDAAFIAEPLSHAELVSEPVFAEQLMLVSPRLLRLVAQPAEDQWCNDDCVRRGLCLSTISAGLAQRGTHSARPDIVCRFLSGHFGLRVGRNGLCGRAKVGTRCHCE